MGTPPPEVKPLTSEAAALGGDSVIMRRLRAQLERAAPTGVPVLLQGESGTGKDLAARWLHQLAGGPTASFLKLSCPGLLAGLQDADPFGLRLAGHGGGTLFLDQVAELGLGPQGKILEWLQEGSGAETAARPRLVASTNRDLAAAMAAGQFRRDLFYRLSVVLLRLPPLRERREDLPYLAGHFLNRCNRRFGAQAPYPSARVWHIWEGYDWPGNLRELENLLQRYVILGSEEALLTGLAPAGGRMGKGFPLDGSVSLREMTRRAERQLERELIWQALQLSHGNRKRAAELLRISYRALLYKIKNAGMPPRRLALKPAAPSLPAASEGGPNA